MDAIVREIEDLKKEKELIKSSNMSIEEHIDKIDSINRVIERLKTRIAEYTLAKNHSAIIFNIN